MVMFKSHLPVRMECKRESQAGPQYYDPGPPELGSVKGRRGK